jgi:hypothetical protein
MRENPIYIINCQWKLISLYPPIMINAAASKSLRLLGFVVLMTRSAVQDFSYRKIFSTAFGCSRWRASRDQMVRAG